jgi:hypothetical protein
LSHVAAAPIISLDSRPRGVSVASTVASAIRDPKADEILQRRLQVAREQLAIDERW